MALGGLHGDKTYQIRSECQPKIHLGSLKKRKYRTFSFKLEEKQRFGKNIFKFDIQSCLDFNKNRLKIQA
ncbi:hypothetical protein M0802_009482 [Mischocyttarus mexicanus]|nr:hypothetical protein M0802_009482 [Mischocyttarus mexicanus]